MLLFENKGKEWFARVCHVKKHKYVCQFIMTSGLKHIFRSAALNSCDTFKLD